MEKKRRYKQIFLWGLERLSLPFYQKQEEEAIVAFRKMTRLALDDVLFSLQETIPHLTRSSLHRCLKRHGCSVLPKVNTTPATKKKFKAYPIGYFHTDIAEVRTLEGKL